MGYRVSSLTGVPKNLEDWHLFAVTNGASSAQEAFIAAEFDEAAKRIGSGGITVKGHDRNLSEEIEILVQQYGDYDLYLPFTDSLILLISKGDLLNTGHPVRLVPIPKDMSEDGLKNLFFALIDAIAEGRIQELLGSIESTQLRLEGGSSVLITLLENLITYFEVKPGIFGVSIDIDRGIEDWLERAKRRTLSNKH